MGSFSIWHWLIVLVVVLAIFGTGKLRNMGKDLGSALKGFKDELKDDKKDHHSSDAKDPKELDASFDTSEKAEEQKHKEKQ